MPSSSRLHYLISDGYTCNDKSYCVDSYNQWLTSNCLHPQRLQITDSHSGELRSIDIPCGKCYHCRETKINSWVTRMYAHMEDFKNAYFVTLTYKSFSCNLHPAEKMMLSKLGDAAYVLDSFNETKRLCYSPCLLIKKHYQNFLKRLRKYTGINDITYVISGEYGKKYGRPHFHLILFTNSSLSYSDIKRAWSIALFRDHNLNWHFKRNQSSKNGTSYFAPIGKIDFNDLVKNGTLNTTAKVKVDGNFLNASNCFSYVCKYVCKQDSYNKSRVFIAYNNLFEKREFVDLIHNSFDKNEAIAYLRKVGIKYNINSLSNLLKNNHYEEFIPYQGENLYPFNFVRSKVFHLPVPFIGFDALALEIIPRDKQDFIKSFTPFVEFSRGTPIGSIYANRHIQEFANGIFKKPILQSQSYVLPRYFCDKAKDYIFGFRQVRKTIKSTSLVYGVLPNLYRYFDSCLQDVHPRYLYSCNIENYQDLCKVLQSEKCFVDKYDGVRYIFPIYQNNVYVLGFKYDRHLRKYYCVHDSDFCSFAMLYLAKLNNEYKQYYDSLSKSKQKQRDIDACECLLTDLGVDLLDLKDSYESKQNAFLNQRNTDYSQLHKSCE